MQKLDQLQKDSQTKDTLIKELQEKVESLEDDVKELKKKND